MRFNQFIGGEWDASNDISMIINQSNTADIIGEFAGGSVEEVDIAVAAARAAQPAWAVANDTGFGFSSGICATSLAPAIHFRKHSKAGMIMVNLPIAGVDHHVPFGGRKGSSYRPREQGSYACEFYTSVKTSYISS